MKTPFLHLVKRLATATPASWFPACLQEATGYAPQRIDACFSTQLADGKTFAPRDQRLRARHLAVCGALFAAPGYPPLGGLLVLPASDGLSSVTIADRLRAQLARHGRNWLDDALADPRLVAHVDLGAPVTSIAGAAALQFLRDRHALAIGHFYRGEFTVAGDGHDDARFDGTSVCVQIAGLPANLVLWLAAAIADDSDAGSALVLNEDDDGCWLLARQRPLHASIH